MSPKIKKPERVEHEVPKGIFPRGLVVLRRVIAAWRMWRSGGVLCGASRQRICRRRWQAGTRHRRTVGVLVDSTFRGLTAEQIRCIRHCDLVWKCSSSFRRHFEMQYAGIRYDAMSSAQ
jgi:hypothetical protein